MDESSNNSGKVVVIILIIVFVLAALAGGWYWFMYKPEQEAKEKARLEQVAKEKAEQERKAQELESQKKLQYVNLIAEADSIYEQGSWENARSIYAEAMALFPNQSYPRDQINLINARLERSAGMVEVVTDPTGRFYVVISSSIDDDLAMDYANNLSEAGNNVKIVEHQMNELTYFGVSLGDYDTWDQAVSATMEFSSYGEGLWVLKW